MPITLNGDTGIQTPMYNGTITANAVTPSVNMKNRIINGAMVIDQRNAGASVTPSSGNYTLDRWNAGLTQASKFSVAQSTTAPTGFKNSLLVTSLSAYSITSTDIFVIRQPIEGLNTYDLAWGTASAKTVTLSFQVYSSLTGTFGGSLENDNADRSYPFTYTISSANTWTPVSVTITGCPDGTWLTTNAVGILLNLGLGVGSSKSGTAGAWASADFRSATGATSVVGTNGATLYITGVQLEVGSTATSFDYRPYGTELALCQRYAAKYKGAAVRFGLGGFSNSTEAIVNVFHLVEMRVTPSLTVTSIGKVLREAVAWYTVTSAVLNADTSTKNSIVELGFAATGASQGQVAWWGATGGADLDFLLSSEL